jgi:putative MATE family efflux protein
MSLNENKTEESPREHAGRDLTTGSIPVHLIVFSLPLFFGSLMQAAYSFVNAIWVGQKLGTAAMAAVTVSFPVFFVLMAIAMGLTMATSILSAQAYGARDWPRLRRVVQNSTVLVAAATILCLAIGEIYCRQILVAMNTPPDVLALATDYMHIFLLNMPAMFGIFLAGSLLRGIGDSKTPLYFQAVSVVVTAALDPLFMFGWLGFPKLGLNGTAVATIISSSLAFITLAIYMQKKDSLVAPDWLHLKCDRKTSWLILKIGIPSMMQQALVSVGMVVVVGIVNKFGEATAAAYGAATRIDQLAFLPAMNFGVAISTLAGQNIGARKFDRVHQVFRWGVLLSAAVTIIASVFAVTMPAQLLRIFLSDPAVIAIGVPYLRIVGAGYVFFAVMFASNGVINGAGHTFITTIFTLISLWIVRVPLAEHLSQKMHKPEGIWYAMVISFGAGMLVSVIYYLSGRWKRELKGGIPVAGMTPIDEPDAEIQVAFNESAEVAE